MYIRKPYPNELYHYGIKGQKWNVRRYQNKDGSLTAEGKRRYSTSTMYVVPNSLKINSPSIDLASNRIAAREYADGSTVQVYKDGTISAWNPNNNTDTYLKPGSAGYEKLASQFPTEFTSQKGKKISERFLNKTLRGVGMVKDAINKAKSVVDSLLRKVTGSVKVESNEKKPMYETHKNTPYNLAIGSTRTNYKKH